jgi:hypothetical protein
MYTTVGQDFLYPCEYSSADPTHTAIFVEDADGDGGEDLYLEGVDVESASGPYYRQTGSSNGTGSAILRFVPSLPDEPSPFIKLYHHVLEAPGRTPVIENCLGTIGLDCPICEANTILRDSGNDAAKRVAYARRRKVCYVANALIIRDPQSPEKENQVFLYKFGRLIMGKIEDMLEPWFDRLASINPFDIEKGANFRLRVYWVDGRPEYGKSTFDEPGPLGDRQTCEAILARRHSLKEVLSPSQFRTYDGLKAKVDELEAIESTELTQTPQRTGP